MENLSFGIHIERTINFSFYFTNKNKFDGFNKRSMKNTKLTTRTFLTNYPIVHMALN